MATTASLMGWTWVWVNSGSWWWTRRPGLLQSMGSQRVGHEWATELNWTELRQWGLYQANTLHLETVVRSFIVIFQNRNDQFVDILLIGWLLVGVNIKNFLIPKSGVSEFVARILLTYFWWGFQYLQNSSKYCYVYPLRGNQDSALSVALFFFFQLLLPYLCIPSLSYLATLWTCLVELREGHRSCMKPISYNQEMWDAERFLCPEAP